MIYKYIYFDFNFFKDFMYKITIKLKLFDSQEIERVPIN